MPDIRFFGINLTNEIGANDGLVAVRVIPASRDGNKVYGRALKIGEVDPGDPITQLIALSQVRLNVVSRLS